MLSIEYLRNTFILQNALYLEFISHNTILTYIRQSRCKEKSHGPRSPHLWWCSWNSNSTQLQSLCSSLSHYLVSPSNRWKLMGNARNIGPGSIGSEWYANHQVFIKAELVCGPQGTFSQFSFWVVPPQPCHCIVLIFRVQAVFSWLLKPNSCHF